MLFRTRHALVTVLALAGLASCATAKRAACTVPSDCSDGEYCGAPHNGSRTCTFDCRVASDCTGGGPCLPNGQCQEQVMVDDGGMIVDAAPSSDGQVVILPDGSVTPDSSLPIDAAPPIDSAVFMDAAPGACGLVPPQTGCPGQACDLNGATPQCRANGTQAHDALCGINQNCVAGSICLSDGFCHQFCNVGGTTCPNGGACNLPIGFMTQTVGNACSDSCNVLTQNCPTGGTGQACYVDGNGMSHCYGPPGSIAEGSTCMFIDDCAKPLSCIQLTGDATAKCHHMCTTGGGLGGCRATPTAQTCTTVNGFGTTGVCRPAMP